MSYITFYVTFSSLAEAEKIVSELLDLQLIVCGNLFPSQSLYFWQGKVQRDDEVSGLLKTREDKIKATTLKIIELHSYEVPCITHWEFKGASPYLDWLDETLDRAPEAGT